MLSSRRRWSHSKEFKQLFSTFCRLHLFGLFSHNMVESVCVGNVCSTRRLLSWPTVQQQEDGKDFLGRDWPYLSIKPGRVSVGSGVIARAVQLRASPFSSFPFDSSSGVGATVFCCLFTSTESYFFSCVFYSYFFLFCQFSM